LIRQQITIEAMLRYSFSLLVLLFSCTDYDVNSEFLPYLKSFEKEANQRGVNLKYRTVEIRFQRDLMETKNCYAYSKSTMNDKLIVVDTDFWETEPEPKRELVLYHEFGHAFLCRGHEYVNISVMRSDPVLVSDWDAGLVYNKTTDALTGLGNFSASGFIATGETASTIASFDGGKKVTSLPTATYPSLTELSYVKGVTSAIQTQLAAKEQSYTINVLANQSSPGDSVSNFFCFLPRIVAVASGSCGYMYFRDAGTITVAEIFTWAAGAVGTNENWSFYVRLNDTTDYLIATVGAATDQRAFQNSAINVPISSGDYVEIKTVNPAWATNPTNVSYGGYLKFVKS